MCTIKSRTIVGSRYIGHMCRHVRWLTSASDEESKIHVQEMCGSGGQWMKPNTREVAQQYRLENDVSQVLQMEPWRLVSDPFAPDTNGLVPAFKGIPAAGLNFAIYTGCCKYLDNHPSWFGSVERRVASQMSFNNHAHRLTHAFVHGDSDGDLWMMANDARRAWCKSTILSYIMLVNSMHRRSPTY